MSQLSLRESKCQDCPIRNQAVCARCEPDELMLLEQMKYYRSYEAGQQVVWAGDEMGFVGSVVSGVANLSKTMEDGRRQMVGLLLPSDFVGRPGRSSSPYDIVASSDLTLCCFRRGPFEALVSSTPNVADRLLAMTLDELDAARNWMLILGRKTAREKIASLIAILAKRESNLGHRPVATPIELELPLTREAMADYLGLTLETVSRQMSALKAEGIIELASARRVKVPHLGRLSLAAGDEP